MQFNKKRKQSRMYELGDAFAVKRTQLDNVMKLKKKIFGSYEIIADKSHDRY